MCGFAGFLDLTQATPDRERVVRAMAATLLHRGPDDDGAWVDDGAGVALGFRRLAIIDLSPQGHQPMTSHDGRWVISFNGEIYNHEALRARLGEDIGWRGHSDTEVLLQAVSAWGMERALAEFDGMFAFALWDRQDRVLTLARDRFGEKPLYWTQSGGHLLFGSEIKALRAHPAWTGGIDRDALALYMRLGWITAPHTIHSGVFKLEPGHVMRVSEGQISTQAYWSAAECAAGVENGFTGNAEAAADRLEELLRQSVRLRMQADVPVGVFLSGGIDSSITAALMRQLSSEPVHSFTIGFDQSGLDESPHARAVADHLGTIHTEVRISDAEALAQVPRLPLLYDEPFADAAALPTALLAQVTRKSVTVALSGDGADELFGGYGIYRSIPKDWGRLRGLPGGLKSLGALGARQLAEPAEGLAALAGRFAKRRSHPGHRLRREAERLEVQSLAGLLGLHYSRWRGMPALVPGAREAQSLFSAPTPALKDDALATMVLDACGYLPDDLCVKTDRATMGASLEARLPFLALEIAQFAWSLPTGLKIEGETGKAVLRRVLYRHVPRALVDRPKMGFEVPLRRWLNGQLRDWADDLLSEDRLRRQGFLDTALVAQCWREHRSGAKNWQNEIWHALMFQAWLDSVNP
ncbi:Asparagine synthetase glutamine-hydrolyzing [Paramagnetospirillum magnetotacticum MS-1]|uniref:asparagine synthase (glutamine-hydrolyzing) n=1 Tax=Paramagnetospirillum magnetotacticum MS-1 TaxID=272627 RepID=A0A0C2V3L6_PARME|nr:asparagine synthase (glutamine-hydrolyzing) [Paramagnetospirillum magnetotacticum]KIL99651.1 Asparagine synthetase glutamine-hydrolyzing [Paramagnetospirillum magnetotacticum MS-1]